MRTQHAVPVELLLTYPQGNGLAHIKLNEHKLNQRKQKIVENNQLPNVAQKVQAHKKVASRALAAYP